MTLSTRGLQLAQALIHGMAEGKIEPEMQAEALSTAMAVLTVARSPSNASLQLAMIAVNREYRQFCEEAFSKGIVSVEQVDTSLTVADIERISKTLPKCTP